MKGYIFAVRGDDPVEVMRRGLFGVHFAAGSPWSSPMLATFADHTTIRPDDLVFFFSERTIFGIGRVIDPYSGLVARSRGVLLNYPGATLPGPQLVTPETAVVGPEMDANWQQVRLVIPFVPYPVFFSRGVDMDEVLGTASSDVAWGLRSWERASFAQLGEEETQLLVRVFLRRFGNAPVGVEPGLDGVALRALFTYPRHSPFSMCDLVAERPENYIEAATRARQEFALHGLLSEAMDPLPGRLGDLASPDRLDVYHEVTASPPKPPKWQDSIDLMATRRFPQGGPSIGIQFDLVEAKRGRLPYPAPAPQTFDEIVTQLMKYVDFVAGQYAGGNYSAISATYVAHEYSTEIRERYAEEVARPSGVMSRSYVLNSRETPPTRFWQSLRLATYAWSHDERRARITFL